MVVVVVLAPVTPPHSEVTVDSVAVAAGRPVKGAYLPEVMVDSAAVAVAVTIEEVMAALAAAVAAVQLTPETVARAV